MAQRPPLTLTAELEKLEQSITLTLQEIDHNFSKTHRIITNSILPIVERYAKESTAVWEGSKFWKQFFEASANVALSNYEEDAQPQYTDPTTVVEGTTFVTHDSSAFPDSLGNYSRTRGEPADETVTTTATAEIRGDLGSGGDDDDDDDDYLLDDSMLDSLNLTGAITHHSTPKPKKPAPQQQQRQWANIESPFDTLKKELVTADLTYNFPTTAGPATTNHGFDSDSDDSVLPPPSTPTTNRSRRPPPSANPKTPTTGANTFTSSPFFPPPTTARKTPGATGDALLHRVLDKNWRVQATPLGKPPATKYRTAVAATPHSSRRLFVKALQDSDDDSDDDSDASPEKPTLHTKHMFSPSPVRAAHLNLGPKTPTTAKSKGKGKGKAEADPWDDDDDEEDEDNILGYSPPQTIQFSFPQSKLLATPAREASRRIVKDILVTAGAGGGPGGGDSASFSSPPFVSGRGGERWGEDEDIF